MSRASAAAAVQQAHAAAPLFAALGDETRLQLLLQLSRQGPGSIAQLSAGASVSRQAVTKHLQVLADAGYVQDERRGRERVWRLQPRRFEDAKQCLNRISREWGVALDRLKRFVET
jgi:DNA-binding transcriptional ArsR family regulator